MPPRIPCRPAFRTAPRMLPLAPRSSPRRAVALLKPSTPNAPLPTPPPLTLSSSSPLAPPHDPPQMFDTDGDGSIDCDEIAAMLRKFGFPPADAKIRELVRSADSNQNGVWTRLRHLVFRLSTGVHSLSTKPCMEHHEPTVAQRPPSRHGCCTAVTRLLHDCYTIVTRPLHDCYRQARVRRVL